MSICSISFETNWTKIGCASYAWTAKRSATQHVNVIVDRPIISEKKEEQIEITEFINDGLLYLAAIIGIGFDFCDRSLDLDSK